MPILHSCCADTSLLVFTYNVPGLQMSYLPWTHPTTGNRLFHLIACLNSALCIEVNLALLLLDVPLLNVTDNTLVHYLQHNMLDQII